SAFARPVQRLYRLRESLDTASLLSSFRHVVASHPPLRLRLLPRQPWSQCFPELEADIPGLSVQGRTPEARAAYARHVFAQDIATPFDLRAAPPFIARLIEVDGDHYFGLSLDHLAADDIATDLLEQELEEAYGR